MATSPLTELLEDLRRAALVHGTGGITDGQLLENYLLNRDEAAFEGLLARHGPMVLGVCRRVLQNAADVEDAFQATFLVLVRKAASIVPREMVGNWLYGVAYRTASRANVMNAKRRAKEKAAARPEARQGECLTNLWPVLDKELSRLPDKYRSPLVLCDLEGRTRREAAQQLGWPEGTLSTRLTAARKMLARALARHGLALAGAPLALALSQHTASALPGGLAVSTRTAAARFAAQQGSAGVTSAKVIALTEGVLKSMFLTKLKTALSTLLAVCIICTPALFGYGTRTQDKGVPNQTASPAAKASDDKAPPAKAEPPAGSAAAQFAKLQADYYADFKAMNEALQAAKADQPGRYIITGQIRRELYLPKLLELGRCDDEATACSALTLAVYGWPQDKRSEEAFDLLLKRFASSPHLAQFARQSLSNFYPAQKKQLDRLVAEAKDPAAVGLALLRLGREYDENVVLLKLTPEQAEQRRQKALEYYRRVVSEFPEIDGGKAAAMARRSITRIQQLRVGLPAPAIEGPDLQGKPMKLADFKDKVVVLDFWGSWCGPCRRKLPMMKEVAAKYADKGVVFLGVMAEAKAEHALKAVAQEQVAWPNWLDLRDAQGDSPIVKAWGVVTFPSVYILDRTGTIRFTHLMEGDELERALDALLTEKPLPAKR